MVTKINNKGKVYNIYKHMNYRDYYKKNTKNVKFILPEGVNADQLKKGIRAESKNTNDLGFAAKIAIRHLNEDANYYNRLSEQEDNSDCENNDCNCGAQDCGEHKPHSDTCNVYGKENEEIEMDDESAEIESGMPTVDGALAVPHRGQAIHMSKIIQVAGFNKSEPNSTASGELSGYTAVQSPGDKETLTAGGKKVDSSIASKTVGGDLTPGEGQKQGGPNHGGTIDGTKPLSESNIRSTVKNLLKEIKFDAKTKKWVKIQEASYKVASQTLARVNNGKDQHSRIGQTEPEITETCGEEECLQMETRYNELVNAKRNLSEAELSEMNELGKKIEEGDVSANANELEFNSGAQYKVNNGEFKGSQNGKLNRARQIQNNPNITEDSDDALVDMSAEREKMDKFDTENPTLAHRRKALAPADKFMANPDDAEDYVGTRLANKGQDFLKQVHADISKKDPSWRADDTEKSDDDDGFDNTEFRGKKEKPALQRDPEFAKLFKGKRKDSDEELGNDLDESGVGAVQHKSFRTSKDGQQDPKNRFDPELSESTEQKPKASETAKQIKKTAKGGKVNKPDDLKYKTKSSKTTKSGVKKEN